jgi:toxin-antitoxin system PIN domain toxin
MVLLDVNVLVYAHRQDTPHHLQCLAWLENLINSDHAYGLFDLVLSGFLRIVTHPGVFNPPSSMEKAFAFMEDLRNQQTCIVINPGPRHWDISAGYARPPTLRATLYRTHSWPRWPLRAAANGSLLIATIIAS